YAPANLGQAKHLAKAAYLEMESQETGSAGSEVASMVANFSTNPGINYAPLNLGQLKALAKPFYDVMHAADGFIIVLSDGTSLSSGEYPWDPATPLSANYAPANLGQLKYVFSFSLEEWGVEVTPPEVPGEYERAFVYLVEPTIRYAVVGQAIGLKAVASFPGDTVSGVEFYTNGVLLGSEDSSPPYESGWSPSGIGTNALQAKASSLGGGSVLSPVWIVVIQEDVNGDGLGDAWAMANGVTGPGDDDDGDGMTALDEFASGLSAGIKDHPVVGLEYFSVSL
ncbi:Ig-like domain-containing protein, partial [Ruficoccus amylovorans]